MIAATIGCIANTLWKAPLARRHQNIDPTGTVSARSAAMPAFLPAMDGIVTETRTDRCRRVLISSKIFGGEVSSTDRSIDNLDSKCACVELEEAHQMSEKFQLYIQHEGPVGRAKLIWRNSLMA